MCYYLKKKVIFKLKIRLSDYKSCTFYIFIFIMGTFIKLPDFRATCFSQKQNPKQEFRFQRSLL